MGRVALSALGRSWSGLKNPTWLSGIQTHYPPTYILKHWPLCHSSQFDGIMFVWLTVVVKITYFCYFVSKMAKRKSWLGKLKSSSMFSWSSPDMVRTVWKQTTRVLTKLMRSKTNYLLGRWSGGKVTIRDPNTRPLPVEGSLLHWAWKHALVPILLISSSMLCLYSFRGLLGIKTVFFSFLCWLIHAFFFLPVGLWWPDGFLRVKCLDISIKWLQMWSVCKDIGCLISTSLVCQMPCLS